MQEAYIGSASNDGGTRKKANNGRGGQGQRQVKKGGGNHRRCFRCKRKGHYSEDCKTAEKDFLPRCENCSGFGHNEDKCPSEEQMEHAVLACVMAASDSECDSVENQAF